MRLVLAPKGAYESRCIRSATVVRAATSAKEEAYLASHQTTAKLTGIRGELRANRAE
jgi:hypothetical protein